MVQVATKEGFFVIEAIFDQTLDEVIPAAAIDCLPLSTQRVSEWEIGNDLGRFFTELHNVRLGALLSDGTYAVGRGKDLVPEVFQREHDKAIQLRKKFDKEINVRPESIELAESKLGRALKYFAAWNVVSAAVREESAFTSLPHVLEGSADLECVLHLLTTHFYKQASLILRAFLEGQIVDLALARDENAFLSWKAGTYKVPSIRGRKGLLAEAVLRGELSIEFKSEIESLYDQLNSSVHGAERTLIHSGVFIGRYSGHAFRLEKFLALTDQLSDVTDVCLQLMRIKTVVWSRALKGKTDKCESCRDSTLVSVAEFEFGNREFVLKRCQSCGHKSTLRKDTSTRVYVVHKAFDWTPLQKSQR
jgi:hypothetical protein